MDEINTRQPCPQKRKGSPNKEESARKRVKLTAAPRLSNHTLTHVLHFIPPKNSRPVLTSSHHLPPLQIKSLILLVQKGLSWNMVLKPFAPSFGDSTCENLKGDLKKLLEGTKTFWGDGDNALVNEIVSRQTDPSVLEMMLKAEKPEESTFDPGANKNRALMMAINASNRNAVRLLIADERVNPADANNLAIRFATLQMATYQISTDSGIDIIKMLLQDERVNPAAQNNYTMRKAAIHGCTEIVKMLLRDPRVNPADKGNYRTIETTSSKHKGIVDTLRREEVHATLALGNKNALQWATYHGHTKIVKMLLADGRVNPADENNLAIQWACQWGHLDVVEMLLKDERVNPADQNNNAIRLACKGGHTDVVKRLLADPRVSSMLSAEKRLKYQKQIADAQRK